MSMHDAAVPTLLRVLGNLKHVLKKGEAHAEARKVDPAVLLNSRLALDMHPLVRQVQMVSDSAKGGAARLAGVEPPSMPDTETNFAELYQRIDKTVDFIKSLKPEQFDGADTRVITLQFPGRELKMSGQELLGTFTLPNLFFHAVTAYNILRHNGVEIGKMDFLAGGQAA
ncbi:MAG: DUF1993 domain-containing protein [Alphaproteobacteria bacterium]|nr:DUF1993 domain-containing protein [Alphaproteobacteria bacterium]